MTTKAECENCGCEVKISANEKIICKLDKRLITAEGRINGMIMRLNVVLGGIAVAVILLAIDLVMK